MMNTKDVSDTKMTPVLVLVLVLVLKLVLVLVLFGPIVNTTITMAGDVPLPRY